LQEPGVLINRTSLSQTVDAIMPRMWTASRSRRLNAVRAARWIAARQGLPGAYGGTFAGFPSERSRGIVLFTGERITSASARHILGEEGDSGVEVCGARPGARGEPSRAVSGLWTTPARVAVRTLNGL